MYTADDWIISIDKTIPILLFEEPTKDRAVILAALYTLKNELSKESFPQPEPQFELIQNQPPIAGKRASDYYMLIEHEMSDADTYYTKGNRVIGKSEYEHMRMFIDECRKYAYDKDSQIMVKGFQVRADALSNKIK